MTKRKRATQAATREASRVETEERSSGFEDDASDVIASDGTVDMDDVGQDDQSGDEWGGITDEQTKVLEGGVEHPKSKPNQPPTGQELRAIQEAGDLFQSSSFKLQIDALLPNVRLKDSRIPPLERFLHTLHPFLMSLPSIPPQHPLEASRKLLKHGIAIPYPLPLPTEDTNWKVAFEKPNDIVLVGSWANKMNVKSKDGVSFGVDLAVEMPDSLFQEKDYLNGRFFHKRAYYLAALAKAIKDSKQLPVDVAFNSLVDDSRLTTLVLTPRSDDSAQDFTKLNAVINIFPCVSESSPIPLHRLSPSHSNIRANSSAEEGHTNAVPLPSPRYNNALLHSFVLKPHLLLAHNLKSESPAFVDALTLLRVWANQRGCGDSKQTSVRGFHGKGIWWTLLLAAVILGEEPVQGDKKSQKRRPVGRGLSSYQLFRAALDLLAKRDFQQEPLFLKSKDGHLYPPEELQQHHKAICVDSTSRVNVLLDVPLGCLQLLRYEAQKTLEVLDQPFLSGDSFAEVFLKERRDLPSQFDALLRIDLSSAKLDKLPLLTVLDCGSPMSALLASIDSTLQRGLGNRSKAIAILHPPSAIRPVSQAHPSSPDVIFIGLIHNTQHAFRLVDHGPAVDENNQQTVSEFRELWGNKAELRRFKDGRINESVVWDVKTVDERAHIPSMIVQHLLQHHFGIRSTFIKTWQTSFDSMLRLPESISSLYLGSGMATGFKGAMTAFDNLVRSIRALGDDLPLSLMTVSPISESLRYTSVFSPVPVPESLTTSLLPNARYQAPIEIVLEFERSTKWPDDLRAIQKIKLAFFERLASSLMSSVDGLRANVVIGDGMTVSEITDQAFVEITTPEGWAFWARIWHNREITLLDRIIDNKNGVLPHVKVKGKETKGKDYYEAVEAKDLLTRRFIHGPRHHRAIASLAHQYQAFGGTVRLVKRWLASHWLLHGHISEEAVELICARSFVGGRCKVGGEEDKSDDRASVPGSKERGFALVIAFLKSWSWEDGLHVPLYGAQQLGAEAGTPQLLGDASGVWVIATEVDTQGRVWTSRGPDIVAAHRVRAVAKATWEYLQGVEKGHLDVKAMFIHPTSDYDFLVTLDQNILPRYLHNVTANPDSFTKRGKPSSSTDGEGQNVVTCPGLDPARLLFDDLQRLYTNTFKLFYDPYGGDRYGGVWEPSLESPRPFKVLSKFSSLPASKNDKGKDKGMVTLNRGSVLAEIVRLGTGLVTEVNMNT
ncbi:Nrap protein [Pluteus cervinus]|uniref:Nrap protein n=1 Tax=Pluteus cervinus TaxID=181527 RepID=A0ACD3B1W9_9AGAR|nr:Nrap protein [Pluteus cervinus]